MLLRIGIFAALVVSTCAVDSSFAFAQVTNVKTGNTAKFCVNHQKYQNVLPISPELAIPVKLSWYTNHANETEICAPRSQELFPNSSIVPIRYVTADNNASCLSPNPKNLSFMDLQMEKLAKKNVDTVLFLVEKGKAVEVAPSIHKYLFAQFYNPEMTATVPDAYYIYYEDFFNKLLPMADDSAQLPDTDLEVSFFRPKSWPFDFSEVIILIIALFCIIVGSIWGARTLEEKYINAMKLDASEAPLDVHGEPIAAEEGSLTSDANASETHSIKSSQEVTFVQQLIGVTISVIMIVAILMIAFFFRNAAVWFFNVFITIAGTICIAKILTSIYCLENPKILSVSQLWLNKCLTNTFLAKKFGIFTLCAYVVSGSFCLTWLIFLRQQYYGFWFLNTINICLCIVAVKSAQLRNLRVLVLLLCGMFVYDLFMVFGSKLFTKNGCSVMIQVVTGVDCNQREIGPNYYPVAPLEQDRPEVMPLLFYIPLVNDVMQECYDINVEKELRHIMLGLGDVIVPGYLIVYCFIVDKLKPTKFGYGPITVIGYALGLITTFLALRFMQLAQPALIYLVPFTLIPLIFVAWMRGHLKEIWYGKFSNIV